MTIPGPIGEAEIDNGVTIVARQRLACRARHGLYVARAGHLPSTRV
jgi:hypothetical protein